MKQEAGKFSKAQEELIRKQMARAKARKKMRDAQKKKQLSASQKYSGMASMVKKQKNKSLMIKIGGYN